MNERQPSIYSVVIGFNLAEDTVESFKSLQQSTYKNLKHIFVDNNSSDDSVQRVLDDVPEAAVLETNNNTGFARGNNVGFHYANSKDADYVLMINNDTTVDPHMVEELIKVAEASPENGVIVPKIYYYDHKDVIWSAGCSYKSKFPSMITINQTSSADDGIFDNIKDLDFTTTCCLLIRKEVFEKVGLLNPNCFLFWEDYDFCARVRKAGFKIKFACEAIMWHKVSKTTQEKKPSPFIWNIRAKSKSIFVRSFPEYGLGWFGYPLFAAFGFLFNERRKILIPFLKGWNEGSKIELKPTPGYKEEIEDTYDIIRENNQ